MNAYAMRNSLELRNFNTTITRAEFEAHFTESRNAKVYRTNLPGFEAVRLIKVGKGLHYIDEERQITEKATGEKHPEASWLVDIERA